MKGILKIILVTFLVLNIFSVFAMAQTIDVFWINAARILNSNITTPELALSELDSLINNNTKVLQEWKENTNQTRQQRKKLPTQEDLVRINKNIYMHPENQAINEWISALSLFTMKHPHYLDKINLLLKSYIPNAY